jgi:hypothetical protein
MIDRPRAQHKYAFVAQRGDGLREKKREQPSCSASTLPGAHLADGDMRGRVERLQQRDLEDGNVGCAARTQMVSTSTVSEGLARGQPRRGHCQVAVASSRSDARNTTKGGGHDLASWLGLAKFGRLGEAVVRNTTSGRVRAAVQFTMDARARGGAIHGGRAQTPPQNNNWQQQAV